jgi:hypothetical protein
MGSNIDLECAHDGRNRTLFSVTIFEHSAVRAV